MVATSRSPVSTNAPVESDRTVNVAGLDTDIAPSTRRQLEPDLLSVLIRLDAPGVGNRIHNVLVEFQSVVRAVRWLNPPASIWIGEERPAPDREGLQRP